MRITDNMMTYNFLRSLNQSLQRENNIQEQLSDGKAIHRPSDDPVKTVRSLHFNTSLNSNDQYTQNVKDALTWMDTTDGAMSNLSSILQRVKELVVSADGTKPADALQAISTELDGLISAAVDIGNTKIGDRYIFAGQKDKTQPFVRSGDTVTYSGDNNKISMTIQPGVVDPTQDSVNLTGADVFGSNQKVWKDLIEIKQELVKTGAVSQTNASGGAATVGGLYAGPPEYQNFQVRIDSVSAGQVQTASYSLDGGATWNAATPDASVPPVFTLGTTGVTTTIATSGSNAAGDIYSYRMQQGKSTPNSGTDLNWISTVGLANVDADISQVLQAQTTLGARSSTYQLAQNMLENNNTTITEQLSANEDLDIPKAIIDFKTSENVYRTALSVGARIMPPSLVDFLK